MELLRLNNTTSLSASFSGLTASSNYNLELDDLITSESYSASAAANGSGVVSFIMPDHYLTYTGSLVATVKDSAQDIVNITNIEILRPYCNIDATGLKIYGKTSGLTTTERNNIVEYERLARYIIESHTDGFSFIRKEKEFIGSGTDELLLDEKAHTLYKIYENGELMYDASSNTNEADYKINKQLNAIVLDIPESNRINYKKVWRDRFLDIDFFEGYEYIVDADFGWKVIPQDIQEACELLIQDIFKDNIKYINRYIESFDNDDFKIKFAKNWTATTGNLIVDRILERYKRPMRVGVL
jgi:hypothetical protein